MNKSYEADVARLLKLYEEVETDPENEESSDYDSDADPTYEEILDHESDSVQDDVNLENVEPEASSIQTYYFGKDRTKWRQEPNPQNVRTRTFNIVSHLPGVIGNAKNVIEIQ